MSHTSILSSSSTDNEDHTFWYVLNSEPTPTLLLFFFSFVNSKQQQLTQQCLFPFLLSSCRLGLIIYPSYVTKQWNHVPYQVQGLATGRATFHSFDFSTRTAGTDHCMGIKATSRACVVVGSRKIQQ